MILQPKSPLAQDKTETTSPRYNGSMISLYPDTHPEAEAVMIRLLRQAPPWRKLEMVDQLNQSVKLLALTGLRQRYPQEDEECLHRRLADLLLGEELALKVYGHVLREK